MHAVEPGVDTIAHGVRYAVVRGWVLLTLAPLVPLVVWSGAFAWRWPDLWPTQVSGRAWAFVFAPTTAVRPALVSSVLVALLTAAGALAAGTPAGVALGRGPFRGRRAVELALLTPFLIPGLAVTMGIQILFIKLGLADTIPGVVLAHVMPALPYVVVAVSGVVANLGTRAEEQARSLGATPQQAFWHVTLPAIRPGLVVGGVFAFLVSWSQYTTTLVIGGGKIQTLPLLVYTFQQSGDTPVAAALAVVFVAPALLALAVSVRTFRGGVTLVGRV